MILRVDRLQAELPPPWERDPAGAQLVQELLGGKFGEMSTWLNYTFQSFNFRSRHPPLHTTIPHPLPPPTHAIPPHPNPETPPPPPI